MSLCVTVSAASAMVSSSEPLACISDRLMLIAVSHSSLAGWAARFAAAEPSGGVAETASKVAELLQAFDQGQAHDVAVVHAGWCNKEGRVIAFLFKRSRNFQPRRIDKGHAVHPKLYSNTTGLSRIANLGSEAAMHGRFLQDYHAAVFDNHLIAYQAAELLGGPAAPSAYHLAAVESGYCGPVEPKLELTRWRSRANQVIFH